VARRALLVLRGSLNNVSSTPTEIAREGLEAWRAGDFEKSNAYSIRTSSGAGSNQASGTATVGRT
jgi:hypothetical protein